MNGVGVIVAVGGAGAVACWSRARAAAADGPDRVRGGPSPSEAPDRAGSAAPIGSAPSAWARALVDAGVDGDPRRWARVVAGVVGLAAVVGATRGGPAGAVALAAAVVGAGLVARRGAAGRGVRRADGQLADLLEHAGRSLRGGVDLVRALGAAADEVGGLHGAEVAAVVARVEGGASLPSALAPWGRAHPRPPVALAVGALEVAALAGGARARALDGVAATLRARAAVADEARALASQASASATVLVALPLVVTVLGAIADPRVAGDLLGTPVGLACLVAGLTLDGVGAWWMHRIVAEQR